MMMEGESKTNRDLPYGAEYAKSGRAVCKACDNLISQGSLRMSIRKPSRFFDGLQDNWFHFHCFWKKLQKNDINEVSVRGIDLLKWEDQERIREKIIENQAGIPISSAQKRQATVKTEYAAGCRGKCASCKKNIARDTLRIGSKSSWYHVNCFENTQDFRARAESISGFADITKDDQILLKEIFDKKAVDAEQEEEAASKFKKRKIEKPAESEQKEKMKAQTERMWAIREQLTTCLDKNLMQALLELNEQKSEKTTESQLLDQLVDCVMFGCPLPCSVCKDGQMIFSASQHAYVCKGYVTEYTRCTNTNRNPPRTTFKIPKDIAAEAKKILKKVVATTVKKREYCLNDEEEVIRPKSFKYLQEYTVNERAVSKKSESGKHVSGHQIVKNGAVVDPDCDIAEEVHVWKESNGKLWSTILSKADVATGKNSFYKLQLLKHDKKERYYVFRSWGRIGTHIGGALIDSYGTNLEGAKLSFEELFQERTGNDWENLEDFKKKRGKFDIVETDYTAGTDSLQEFTVEAGSRTKLPKEVQEVMKMIFDVESMKSVLCELDIDMSRLPLGRLSRQHLQKAYAVLTDLQKIVSSGSAKYEDYLDATNRFFTLIPHDFGMRDPPLLNSQKHIAEKAKLLDELSEMEIAYRILKSDSDTDLREDPIDVHYKKLHAELEVVDKDSEQYKLIIEYAENTRAPTHDQYTLQITNIFRVKRKAEESRFRSDIPNRHLLWHGSRVSNYAGILSQGLRIAPPEAPSTGYMFGKGIYFADMVTKSANYCYAVGKDGFLLLCDVALGEIQEETEAKAIKKPVKGKNSVKGVGRTIPDPQGNFVDEDGIVIPMGKPVDTKRNDLTLLYNEYIVYDINQVQLKYLVQARFIPNF